jgi:riboflavin kinase/FMN adenylyltransferase
MQKIYKTLKELLNHFPNDNYIVTVGNFDGVHLGHQQLIKQVLAERTLGNTKVVAITFNPHPTFILNNPGPYLLTEYDFRNQLLISCGIDFVVELNFNRDFSTLDPEKFLDEHIFVSNRIKKLFIGYDFAFGANKAGNVEFVREYSAKTKRTIIREEAKKKDDTPISSSMIRKLLQTGNIIEVNKLLTRNFSIRGTVVKGKGRGKVIGFPTANVAYEKNLILPKTGVYITRTSINGMSYLSLVNIGVNPTFGNEQILSLENHVLDFNEDIYGVQIAVEFISRLRDEKKFDSVNELILQIRTDVEKTRDYFAKK